MDGIPLKRFQWQPIWLIARYSWYLTIQKRMFVDVCRICKYGKEIRIKSSTSNFMHCDINVLNMESEVRLKSSKFHFVLNCCHGQWCRSNVLTVRVYLLISPCVCFKIGWLRILMMTWEHLGGWYFFRMSPVFCVGWIREYGLIVLRFNYCSIHHHQIAVLGALVFFLSYSAVWAWVSNPIV